jgi:hypothetical protein
MASRATACVLIFAITVGLSAYAAGNRAAGKVTSLYRLLNQPGTYFSPDKTCRAALTVASMGGYFVLRATGPKRFTVTASDVTAFAWTGTHTLVYSTSPIYGVPGIYVSDLMEGGTRRIVAPRVKTRANPDGADYFELARISHGKPPVVYFYYAPDLEKANLDTLRTPACLYQVHLDGSGFGKAKVSSK